MTTPTRSPLGNPKLLGFLALVVGMVLVPAVLLLRRGPGDGPTRRTEVVRRPYFTPDDAARARDLFAARVADQFDKRGLDAPPGRDALLTPLLGRDLGALGPVMETELTARPEGGPPRRTRVFTVSEGAVRDVAWSDAGRLEVAFAAGAEAVRAPLAGVTRAGLDATSAERVAGTVRGLFRGRAAGVAVVEGDSGAVASVMFPASRTDVAAELLVRGLVRLDLADAATRARQPALVRAALAGLDAPTSLVAEEGYQTALRALDATDAGADAAR